MGDKPLEGLPSTRGLNPSLLIQRLTPLLRHHPTLPIELTNGNLSSVLERVESTGDVKIELPTRTPTFCPGCPHRDSSSVLLELREDLLDPEYMQRHHQRKPVDLVAHGDTGCYTMLMFEPNKPLMHNYSGMGLGGATGAGVDPFIENKQLVFMGDGTFYHSGQVAISQSIYNGQDLTYIILDNKTTAMTGHQGHAGLELDLTGQEMNPLDIERIVRGMVPKDMKRGRPDRPHRPRRPRPLSQAHGADDPRPRREDRHRRQRVRHHLPPPGPARGAQGDQGDRLPRQKDAHERRHRGLRVLPRVHEPDRLPRPQDRGHRLRPEDSDRHVLVRQRRRLPPHPRLPLVRGSHRPPQAAQAHGRPPRSAQRPPRSHPAGPRRAGHLAMPPRRRRGHGHRHRRRILNHAGHLMGYHVAFLDKKGLAIRNGGVYSQIVFTRGNGHKNARHQRKRHGPRLRGLHRPPPQTTADLLRLGRPAPRRRPARSRPRPRSQASLPRRFRRPHRRRRQHRQDAHHLRPDGPRRLRRR